MRTSEVETELGCSKPTALKEMELLKILGVGYITQDSNGMAGEPEKTLYLAKDFRWFLSKECMEIRDLSVSEKQYTTTD